VWMELLLKLVILCQYNSQIHRVPAGRIVTNKQTNKLVHLNVYLYPVHLPNDTLSIAFENTVFSFIPKDNAIVSIGSVLKWRARSQFTLSIELS
jgi:hypothetical protein